jgi:hypothetical protein
MISLHNTWDTIRRDRTTEVGIGDDSCVGNWTECFRVAACFITAGYRIVLGAFLHQKQARSDHLHQIFERQSGTQIRLPY